MDSFIIRKIELSTKMILLRRTNDMEINKIKGVLKIEDRCTCWEYYSSQSSVYKYELLIKKGEKVDLKDHLFCGSFKILDIVSNDEIMVSIDNQEGQLLK